MRRNPSIHYLVPALLIAMSTGCGKKEAPVPGPSGGNAPGASAASGAAPGAPRPGGAPPNVKESFEIDGTVVEVEHSAIDNGRVQDLFDGNKETLGRTENSTAMVLQLRFPTARKTSGLEVTTGSMNVRLTATLSVRGKGEPLVFQKTYTQLPPDPTVTLDFGGVQEVEKANIEIANADGGDGHVHVREVKLK